MGSHPWLPSSPVEDSRKVSGLLEMHHRAPRVWGLVVLGTGRGAHLGAVPESLWCQAVGCASSVTLWGSLWARRLPGTATLPV